MTPEQKAVRQRLLTDFAFYAKHCLSVRTKEGDIKPLVLNPAQVYFLGQIEDQIARTGNIRAVILKGRQQGLSTVVGAYLIFRSTQGKGRKALVVAHKADSTATLFDMTKRYYEHLPQVVKPATSYSSKKELVFSGLQSSYTVATAGGDSIARGETLQLVHLSEVAFWPKSSAAANFNGLLKAVPNAPGTAVFVESTANGVTGVFADLWNGAVAGKNGFLPIFIAWFTTAEYRRPVPPGFTRTVDEDELAARYGLDDEQLAWRRTEIATNGLDMFHQEYPCEPDEAFLTTGRPVFDQKQLSELLRSCPDPIRTMSLDPLGTDFEDDPRGQLKVYEEPDITRTYYIGADVAMGVRGGDYSVAQVLDGDRNQVAVWRGHVHPDFYATVLQALGRMYGDALVAPEANNHGLLTVVRLSKDLLYGNVYTEKVVDKTSDRETVILGFSTTVKSKPMVIDELRGAMRRGDIRVVDRATLEEMRSYIVTETGKLEAEPGCFDDCVMSLAIANYVNEGQWTPIANEAGWYVEGI